jgi:hypothetical protein
MLKINRCRVISLIMMKKLILIFIIFIILYIEVNAQVPGKPAPGGLLMYFQFKI